MKKNNFIRLVLILLLLAFTGYADAQGIQPPSDMQVRLSPVGNVDFASVNVDTMSNPLNAVSDTALFSYSLIITVQDTNNIDTILVKTGTTDGGSEIFQNQFQYSQSNNLPQGTSYIREGNNITIGIGNYSYHDLFYCEIVLKDSSGNTTTPYKYVSQ